MKNIVLIGMPGAGKTTVGALLAKAIGAPLLDTDAMAADEAGMSIAELFDRHGEAYFRDLETRMVCRAAAQSGVIIATGGGAVLRQENIDALRAGGVLFFLDRPPEDIAAADHAARPLLAGGGTRVFDLYHRRIARYRACADFIIPNGGTPQSAAAELLNRWEEAT